MKPDICGFSAWHFFHISLLVPRIEEAPKLSKICAPRYSVERLFRSEHRERERDVLSNSAVYSLYQTVGRKLMKYEYGALVK